MELVNLDIRTKEMNLNMNKTFFALLFLCSLLFACVGSKKKTQHKSISKEVIIEWQNAENDSLIATLANMKTDTLDCSAEAYWKIISKGKAMIPSLIEHLTDTTPTNIYHGCKNDKLNIGELSNFALEQIIDFPTYTVTEIQFDTVILKDGWHCWSFYDYLFKSNKNRKYYQDKVKAYYTNNVFDETYEYHTIPDSLNTNCRKKYNITGMYVFYPKYRH